MSGHAARDDQGPAPLRLPGGLTPLLPELGLGESPAVLSGRDHEIQTSPKAAHGSHVQWTAYGGVCPAGWPPKWVSQEGWQGAFCLPVFDGMQSALDTCCMLAIRLEWRRQKTDPLASASGGRSERAALCHGCQSKPSKACGPRSEGEGPSEWLTGPDQLCRQEVSLRDRAGRGGARRRGRGGARPL